MQASCVSFVTCILNVKTTQKDCLCPHPLPSFFLRLRFSHSSFPLWARVSQPCLGPSSVVSGPSSPQSSEGPTSLHATPWAVPWQVFEMFLFKWHLNKREEVQLYFNHIPWDPVGSRVPVDSAHGVTSVFWFELLCSPSRKGERGGCIWPKMKHFPFKSKTWTWLEGESLSSIIPGPEQSSNKPAISFLEERSQGKSYWAELPGTLREPACSRQFTCSWSHRSETVSCKAAGPVSFLTLCR